MTLEERVLAIEKRLDNLGMTDHVVGGEETLEFRLSVIEGGIELLDGAHLGHTNSDEGEFKEMHGFEPSQVKGDLMKKVEGIQKKIDRILFLLKDTKFTVSAEEAMKL